MAATGHQEDVARQHEQAMAELQTYLSQLTPGSDEYNQLLTQGSHFAQEGVLPSYEAKSAAISQLGNQLITQQHQRIASGGAATPQQAATNLRISGLESQATNTPFEQDIWNSLNGAPGMGVSSPAYQRIIDQANQQVNPEDVFQSTFGDQYKLLQDQIDQEMGRRGLGPGSGLRFERLGRAGIDLVIAEAAQRQRARQQANQENQQRLSNLSSLYGTGENLRTRQLGVAGDLVNLQLGRESSLTNLLNSNNQNSLSNLDSLLTRNTTRAQEFTDFYTNLNEADKRAFNQAVGTLGGPIVGGLVGGKQGATAGLNTASSILASSAGIPLNTSPTTVPSYLGAQRGSTTGVTSSPSNNLSIAQSNDPYDAFKRALAGIR